MGGGMIRSVFLCLLLLAGAACAPLPGPAPAPGPRSDPGPVLPAEVAARNFVTVVDRVEPVAERICRSEAPRRDCDYQILVDRRPELPPNAFQTEGEGGRPVIVFTLALVADVRNQDELAFVLAHEAAHHIAGHIPRTRATAMQGALILGALATLQGANASGVRAAQDLGAAVGSRVYSKDFELEADQLGTVIAFRAGYDPGVGARYFDRLPDPGNRFLGTHPPNADRSRIVAETLATLR
jgi:predicted Zn-dependent protease